MKKRKYGFSAACLLLLFFLSPAVLLSSPDGQLSDITRKKPGQRMRNSSGLFNPESNADSFRIQPGETVVLAELDGPGEIQHIWFTIGAYERRYPRTLVFRIYWDDSKIPSVESPLGDFFAAGNGMRANVSTLPIEVDFIWTRDEFILERPAELNRTGIGRWPYFPGSRIPLDPWGQEYRYLVPGRFNKDSFDVWSVHGHSRNPDLWIGNWKKED